MAGKKKASSSFGDGMPRPLRWAARVVRGLLCERDYFAPLFWLLLLAELVLGVAIIQKVAYTEIDWIAYMEEVGGFLGGEWNYAELKGGTGPLVYPAGFVYLYSALYHVTSEGTNIRLAQYIFLGVYLACIAILMLIYHETKLCPPWVLLFLCASRRIHSIFMLRCFNDCFAMLLLYASLYLLLKHRWTAGCAMVSLAISIKMNVLLFMPAVGILLLQRFGVWRTVTRLLLILVIQFVLAIPFLTVHPLNYLHCAFDFGRAFFYVWTVNFKFVSEEVFLMPEFAKGLLIGHVVVMFIFLHKMLDGGLVKFIRDMLRSLFSPSLPLHSHTKSKQPSAAYIVALAFVMNFIGIAFARSLHYQFYVWYFHTLPLLLFLAPLPNSVRLLMLILIEYSWNVFPATPTSSGILVSCHLVLLSALLCSSRLPSPPSTSPVDTNAKKVQ